MRSRGGRGEGGGGGGEGEEGGEGGEGGGGGEERGRGGEGGGRERGGGGGEEGRGGRMLTHMINEVFGNRALWLIDPSLTPPPCVHGDRTFNLILTSSWLSITL